MELRSRVNRKDDKWISTFQPAKKEKKVDSKRPMIAPARKKGRLSTDFSGDFSGLNALLKAADDLAQTTTPNTVKGKRVTKDICSPVVLGLQCKALTVPRKQKSKKMISISPDVGQLEGPSSSDTLTSLLKNNPEIGGERSTYLKWGITYKRQPANLKAKGSSAWERPVTFQQENSNTPLKGKNSPENSTISPSVTNANDQKLSFEKRSPFWEAIESMEAFRLFPQNPHFRPLDNLNASARERHAILKMVEFSCLYEDMCHLQPDHSRSVIEDMLESLAELQNHGFDVNSLKNRMAEILSWKDKQQALEIGSKEPENNLETERAKVQECDRDIVLLDGQIDKLRDKRERLVKEKAKSKSKIAGWEKIVGENEAAKRECDRKICELVTAPF